MPTPSRQSAPKEHGNGKVTRTVLVCGAREWTDGEVIYRKLAALRPALIIHGAAPGADTLAEHAAKRLQIDYQGYPAKWKLHGKSAGPIRNRHQFDQGKPDLVLAFHTDLSKSVGTRDMVQYALSRGCPVDHYDGKFWRKL
jgi:hypothetical protein